MKILSLNSLIDLILNLIFVFFLRWFCLIKVLEAQMKADLADKETLEAKRVQQEEESRENCKLISEQKAVRKHNF